MNEEITFVFTVGELIAMSTLAVGVLILALCAVIDELFADWGRR